MTNQIPALFTVKYYPENTISGPHFELQLEYSSKDGSFRIGGGEFTFEGLDILPGLRKEVFECFKYNLSTFNVKIVTELNIELALAQAFNEKKDQHYTCLAEHSYVE